MGVKYPASADEHRPELLGFEIQSKSRMTRVLASIAFILLLTGPMEEVSGQQKDGIDEKALHEQQIRVAQAFATTKENQAFALASDAGETVSAEAKQFFNAAKRGDADRVVEMFGGFMKRHHQYENSSNDKSLDTSYWQTMLEVELAFQAIRKTEAKYIQYFVDDTTHLVPPGSIYFGGTDPGRGLITTFSKSHAGADPFFTITQNALADPGYLEYLQRMYGKKISIPTKEDSSKCFSDYMKDAARRLTHDREHPTEPRQIMPGEEIRPTDDGRITVSGQVAVMTINGLLTRIIFDRNTNQEFYVEESFPLDWMNPYLEPDGPILKLRREKLAEIPPATIAKDKEYWRNRAGGMIGNWLTEETSLKTITDFVERVYVRKDLSGFTGDRNFIANQDAQKMFSKLRTSIGGVYDWRFKHAQSASEKEQMAKEAELAYRQAFALCPYSPEALLRYVNLLLEQKRIDDAFLVASASLKVDPQNKQTQGLVEQLKQLAKK